MSTQLATSDLDRPARSSNGDIGDFVALLKPRVMSLVLFTALAGLVAAPGTIHPVLAITALLCIGVGAGASGALNMWYDADIDAQMQRTAARPIPRGKVSAEDALGFGIFLSAASVLTMGLLVNWVAACLLAFTIAFYLVVYTMWLKRSTPQNIVIGGAAGAFPPMVGWAAATGSVSLESIVLFALIFLWTPPHFWALALYRCRDYERVGVPMLPVVKGPDETRRQIWLYSLVLAPTGVLPFVMGFAGVVYGIAATIVGVIFLRDAWRVYTIRDGKAGDDAARKLFKFSILYLFVIFAVLLVENTIGAQTLGAFGLWLS
ncbi:MAG: heme o synthase [Pseudomonadota bacterium]